MKEMDLHAAIELGSPYPYTLVVTLDKKGKPNIMGLSWWTFTSLQPPMIAISVGHRRYTHECLQAGREFVLCFPSKEQAKAAWLCGTRSGREIDKLAEAGFGTSPAKEVRPPLINGATVAYECKIVEQMECGDHTLYNAKIVAIHGDPERSSHIFSIHYRKLISIDSAGRADFELESP